MQFVDKEMERGEGRRVRNALRDWRGDGLIELEMEANFEIF